MSPVGNSTTDNGTIITIPANARWTGSVTLSATLAAATVGSVTPAYPTVTIEGTGADPAPGTIVAQLALATPLINIVTLLASPSTDTTTTPVVTVSTYASGLPATLKLHFNGVNAASAVASGVFS